METRPGVARPGACAMSENVELRARSGPPNRSEETRRSGGDAGTAAVANEKKESSGGDGRDERQLTESFGDVEPVHHPFDHDAGHRRGFLGLILGRILNLLIRLLGLLRGGDLVRHV